MSTAEWLTLGLAAVQILMGIIGAMLLLFMRTILGTMKELGADLKNVSTDLHNFQVSMAQNAMTVATFDQYRQETRQRIHDIADKAAAAEGAVKVLREVVSDYIAVNRPKA